MQYDYSKLLGRITEIFGTQRNFANAMDCSEQLISARLNNTSAWPQSDILKAATVLKFENGIDSIPQYFFTLKVQNS